MRFYHSATALALITTTVFAQECPPGYQKSKKLDWKFCGQGIEDSTLQCATIEVPRDWQNPATSDKLVLQLIRQPSSNPNAKSIIANPGGPGESGIEMVINSGIGFQQTLGDFHVVSFDPRGVGLTMPYKDCALPKDDDPAKWADPWKEGDDQATYEYKRAKALSAVCKDANKDWGTLIGTAYVARDIMAIVEALGEDGLIRYAGYSYGTLLGATLTAMFPKKVARVLLDGNINPEDYYRGDGTEAAADVTKGVENFFAQCAAAGKDLCALADKQQTGQELLSEYNSFLKTLSEMDSSVINRSYIVRDEFFKVLYFRKATAFKDFAVTLKGWIADPNSIKEKTKRDDFQAGKWQKLEQDKAIVGITCGDRVVKDGSPESYTRLMAEYKQKTPYSYDISSAGQFECTVWEQSAAERFQQPFADIETSFPVLIVNTPWDPVTPAISAEASRKAFRGSKLVMSNGVGHCSGAHPNADLDAAIKKYFEEGTLPDKAEYNIEDNNVFRTIPGQAKIPADQPLVTKRDFKYPDYFTRREDTAPSGQIPAGCTKIPVSSSAVLSQSSSIEPSASVSVSVSHEPTPSASVSVSASASESVAVHSESASASISVSTFVSASESHEPTPSASVSVSASVSEPVVLSHSGSASASISVQQSSSIEVQASATVDISQSESHTVTPIPSASTHHETVSVSMSQVDSSSIQHPEVTPSASISAAGEHDSQSSSIAGLASVSTYDLPSLSASASVEHASVSSSVSEHLSSSHVVESASASASVSVDYSVVESSITQHLPSSYLPDSLTNSASATPISDSSSGPVSSSAIYSQEPSTITASASYSLPSSAEPISSSDLYASSDIPVSHSESLYSPSASSSAVQVDVSSEYSGIPTSAPGHSASVSQSYPASEPSSSIAYSDSSAAHISESSTAVQPDVTSHSSVTSDAVYSSTLLSVTHSESSHYPSIIPSSISYSDSSRVYPSASLSADSYPSSTLAHPSGSSTPGSEYSEYESSAYNPISVSTVYASSTPIESYPEKPKSIDPEYPWSTDVLLYPSNVPSYPHDPKNSDYKSGFSTYLSSRPSSVPPYPKDDEYDYPKDNHYPTAYYSASTPGKPTGPKITSTPCPTVAWSSQSGYVPITMTYTTTNIRTITKCPGTIKNCPLDSLTKAYVTTETKTRTTVVATPSSPPHGDKPYAPNKEGDKKSSATPSKETGKVPRPPQGSSHPSQPAKDTGKDMQPPKETKLVSPSQPAKDTGYPIPHKPSGSPPQSPKETKPIQASHSAYAPPKLFSTTKPSVPTRSSAPYPTGPSSAPSIKVCHNMSCSYVPAPTGTKPVIVGTGVSEIKGSTTLRTSTPSVSACVGKDCKATGTPTGYKPAQFTGAAGGNFVSSMVGAAGLIVAFAHLI